MSEPTIIANGVAVPYVQHRRPPLVWAGGKINIADWIVSFLDADASVYVEPYAGSAAVLLALPRRYPVEVLNDLDGHLVTFYRVLQDRAKFRELLRRLVWTPYARAELARAIETLKDPAADDVSRAWAVFVAHNQGMSGVRPKNAGEWSRSRSGRGDCTRTHVIRVQELRSVRDRLLGVQIESRDALDVIRYWDSPRTVFYVDPPYHPETLHPDPLYAHVPDASHHEQLVRVLLEVEGQVVLSGYEHDVYRPIVEAGWERYEREVASRVESMRIKRDRRRTEVLWVKRKTRQLSFKVDC
jgi:DNA adenine methylase